MQDLWSHLWPVIFCTFMAIGGMRSARKGALADEDTEMKDVTNTNEDVHDDAMDEMEGEKMRKHPQRYQ